MIANILVIAATISIIAIDKWSDSISLKSIKHPDKIYSRMAQLLIDDARELILDTLVDKVDVNNALLEYDEWLCTLQEKGSIGYTRAQSYESYIKYKGLMA